MRNTNTNHRNRNNEDKKYFKQLILMGVIGVIGGFVFGTASKILAVLLSVTTVWQIRFAELLAYLVPGISVLINVGVFMVSLILFMKIKKQVHVWDGEDEFVIGEIEYKLNWPLLLSNVMMVCNYILFAIGMELCQLSSLEKKVSSILTIVVMVTFVVSFLFEISISKLVIDLEKELNPEKKGSIYDMQFSKKWEDSCDEAQKLSLYKAGFMAWKAGNMACLILWVIALLAQFMFGAGVFPSICIGIIWLTMLITYSSSTMKAEKNAIK